MAEVTLEDGVGAVVEGREELLRRTQTPSAAHSSWDRSSGSSLSAAERSRSTVRHAPYSWCGEGCRHPCRSVPTVP